MRVAWRKEMKLGVGLYRYMLKDEEFTFARQCGCSDVIIHLANYYDGENDIVKATDEKENYGIARAGESVWSLDHMMALQKQAKEKGLNITELRISVRRTGMIYCWMDLKRKNRWSI